MGMHIYSADRLPIAGFLILLGLLSILFRRQIARGSNGLYGGLGIRALVRKEGGLKTGQVISGIALIVVGGVVAISAFIG